MALGEYAVQVTVEIHDDLAKAAIAHAERLEITLQELIVDALSRLLEQSATRDGFRLRDASVGGRGLKASAASATESTLRDWIYRDRGA